MKTEENVTMQAETAKKKPYEKPMIIESEGITFTKEIWEDFSEGNWCFGCTNCNCSSY
jgi:hypothetical protein